MDQQSKNADMSYIHRFLEQEVERLAQGGFGAVLIAGPRQAGKSTLLQQVGARLFGPTFATRALDVPADVEAIARDPELFLLDHPGVVLLDEIQHAPNLLPWLKREIDKQPGKLRFLLSGSQQFGVMKGVAESLAGRVAVLDLWPFAEQEVRGADIADFIACLEDPERLRAYTGARIPLGNSDVLALLLRGGYPASVLGKSRSIWFESYRRTYLHRDVRDLREVGDLGRFDRFLVLMAGRAGTVVNRAEIARTLGLDHKTVDRWCEVLEASFVGFHLPAFERNPTKRLVRRPKWVFGDSGLGCHLQAIRAPDTLSNAPHFGSLFESWVLAELRKLFAHAAVPWDGAFWRTQDGRECDLVLPGGGRPVPVEIKHAATLTRSDWRGLEAFLDEHPESQTGILLSLAPEVQWLSRRVVNVPIGAVVSGLGTPPAEPAGVA